MSEVVKLVEVMAEAITTSTHRSGEEWAGNVLSALDAAGYVLVPKSAIDWLDGAAPDAEGKWFGDDIPPGKPYWWRSRFRALIAERR